jgi:tetratricopeptide (TPR) repeat protein
LLFLNSRLAGCQMKHYRAAFFVLAFVSGSICSFAQIQGMDPRQTSHSQFGSRLRDSVSVSGTVRDLKNNPLKDVRVELTDANGALVNAVYTNSSGSFEFANISTGIYNMVATAGLQQVSERVEVNSWTNAVNLRMRSNDKPDDGVEGNSVSVMQYKVPGKARDEYRKAREGMEKGKLEEATKRVENALQIFPNYADALTLRAILELNRQSAESAMADLDKAVKADANYAMAYMVMGSALNMQSKFDEAIRALQRGESLAPNYWQAYFEMGKAYIGKADYPAALRQLERAQNTAPAEYPLIYLLQAHALLAMKQYPEAMTALQAYLQKDPKGPNSAEAQKMLEKAQAFLAKGSK